jgi:hypothetical protein
VLAAVLGVALVSYRLCVRHTWIGSWLNGRRVARASTNATAEAGPRPAPG